MKSLLSTFFLSLFSIAVIAQAPQHMNYQAVVRDGDNGMVTNSSIGMRLQILKGTEFGAAVYVETHAPQTNGNGLINLQIGTGSVINGNFSNIDWSDGPFFLKTEIDPQGGANYSLTSTAQMVSVPYALYAQKAAEVVKTPTAFNVNGGTFQDLPKDEITIIDFTDEGGSGGAFIKNDVFSFDRNEYTAPEDGVYFFEAYVTVDNRGNPTNNSFYLYYYVNGYARATLRTYQLLDGYPKITFNTTLDLKKGDKVTLRAKAGSNGIDTMGGNSTGTVRMTGFKVE